MRKATAAALLGLGAAFIVLTAGAGGVFDRIERQFYDWRTRVTSDPASIHPNIVLVEINDLSIRDLAPAIGRWPWPRAVIASLIDFISRAPARVIAVDITL
ncbi:MAG: CHASE2 domain-containing protein, partial [Vicinamibacterales bacterium]